MYLASLRNKQVKGNNASGKVETKSQTEIYILTLFFRCHLKYQEQRRTLTRRAFLETIWLAYYI